MAKVKTAFFCKNCGHESAKWIGKCPSCEQWNTFIEEIIQKDKDSKEDWKDFSESKRKSFLYYKIYFFSSQFFNCLIPFTILDAFIAAPSRDVCVCSFGKRGFTFSCPIASY